MTTRVPTWAFLIMCCLLLQSLSLGILSDTGFLDLSESPFAVNLLSSVTAFSASGIFAGIVVNRYVRRRYWGVELNRRVASVTELEAAVTSLGGVFGLNTARQEPDKTRLRVALVQVLVDNLLASVSEKDAELKSATTLEAFGSVVRVSARAKATVSGLRGTGERIERHLNFVSDEDLLYATDRLDHKLGLLEAELASWDSPANPADSPALLRAIRELAGSVRDVSEWLLNAPDPQMRELVAEGLRDSAIHGAR